MFRNICPISRNRQFYRYSSVVYKVKEQRKQQSVIEQQYSPSDIYVSGYSWDGQMGIIEKGSGPHYGKEPMRIEKFCLEPIRTISCGLYHIVALSEHGVCYSWGCDYQSQVHISTYLCMYLYVIL